MTHQRVPLTFSGAMTKVAGLIGYPAAAALAGRAERTVYAWANPATRTAPPIDQALAYDAAYREAGGEDTPFLDAYAFQLDVTLDRADACRRALAGDVATLAREIGDAIACALALTHPNASPRDALNAFAEAQHADAALDAVLRRLASFLPTGTGQGAGNAGEPQ